MSLSAGEHVETADGSNLRGFIVGFIIRYEFIVESASSFGLVGAGDKRRPS